LWLLGSERADQSFPLLLKYLDCNRVLSVQVHPSDEYALRMDEPDLGKTEAWYIVAAEADSQIYAGLKPDVDRDALQDAIRTGTTEQVLHSFHPNPGDVVFIPAGTVHALGAGLLVAEIQQSSNTTFRLFDWNRLDAEGNSRPLHLKQGVEVTDFETGPIEPRTIASGQSGWQEIVHCDKFVLRLIESGSGPIAGDGKFHILTVPRGKATLRIDGEVLSLATGETLLLPAAMTPCSIETGPQSTVMGMHLPD
ncbi:MAG: class I mannose-6-phosphate isomerase, partial [Rubripirellula sp.]